MFQMQPPYLFMPPEKGVLRNAPSQTREEGSLSDKKAS